MGVLFFASDISLPSVLWMRRMLEGLGDDVSVLASEADPGASYRRRYETVILRDDVTRIGWRLLRGMRVIERLPKTRGSTRPLLRALESRQVSVALVHYLTSAVDYRDVWRRSDKPVFVHCHGWDVTWDKRRPTAPGQRVHPRDYVAQVRGLSNHVQFIANSKRTAERLTDIGIADTRIHLKYLGAPIPDDPPALPRNTVHEVVGVVERGVTILYLGNLVDFKGPEVAIEAFTRACDRGLRGRMIVAGDGPMRGECERIRALSRHADRIEFVGAVDGAEGERLRREADIFTAHNRTGPVTGQEEAFGVSIVEAMAAGLPVVTGKSGSLPEVVEDSVQGFLVAPGDVDAHADCLLRLARDPDLRASMGRAGWQRARDQFSIDREMSTLRSILGLSGQGEMAFDGLFVSNGRPALGILQSPVLEQGDLLQRFDVRFRYLFIEGVRSELLRARHRDRGHLVK